MSTTTAQPTVTPQVETSRWRIDPERSSVEFRARTFWGLMTVKGRFERYDVLGDHHAKWPRLTG